MSAPVAVSRRRVLLDVARLARPCWTRLGLAALAGAGAVGAAVALTATSAWLLSRAAQHPPVLTLMVAIVAVRAFGIGRGVLRYAERLLSHDAAFRILASLRVAVFAALERVAPAGLGTYRSGDLLARLVDDVDALQDLYLRVALPVAAGSVVGLATVVGIGWASPAAALALALGLVAAGCAVPWWSSRAGARAHERGSTARAELSTLVLDTVQGSPDLVAYGAQTSRLGAVDALGVRLGGAARSEARVAGVGAALSSFTSGATTLACLVIGIAAVRSGALPGVLLATVVLTPLAAFEAVGSFPEAARHLGAVRAAARRVLDVVTLTPLVTEPVEPASPPRPPVHVRVERVDARWPGAARPTLSGVTLDLPPGRRVAVVGPSGAGKSTLLAVLLGFLPPSAGQVHFGERDLADLADADLRRLIGASGQDAHVFDATIADNVRIGCVDATTDQLRQALRSAGLLEWVDGLPAGLETPVGEHGRALSGGQRQRLALARELVADHPVVLLDEPTEHLEDSLADALTADLLAAVDGRTTVLVTHRLSGLETVDEIVVLRDGSVAQRGRHEDLVLRPGWYRDMWLSEREDAGVSVSEGSAA